MLCLGVSTLVSHSVVALTMRHWILYLVLLYIILSKNKISALLYKMLNSMYCTLQVYIMTAYQFIFKRHWYFTTHKVLVKEFKC